MADKTPARSPASPPEPEPAWWIADTDLYQGGEHTMPILAFPAGERVPHEHVRKFSWQGSCHIDQWAPAPPTPPTPSEE